MKGMELKSWDDVDMALRLKGECELGLDTIEADMNMRINDIKQESEKLAKPLKEKIKLLEGQIKEYAEENKTDIEGRTKNLTFGKKTEQDYRQPEKVRNGKLYKDYGNSKQRDFGNLFRQGHSQGRGREEG